MNASSTWKLYQQVSNAIAIANGLKTIPAHWSLTPLRDKAPFRENWQTEPFISHENFTAWLLDGEKKFSKKSFKPYQAYISGYGLRTGDSSNGLVAIDVDGASVEPLLQALSNGDLPKTVSWTSGKEGRRQLLFQVPDKYWQQLKDFNRSALTKHNDIKTANGEQLEIRYNNCQSVLPPSRHPQTGAYSWINSPSDCEVAIAPKWLYRTLLNLANQEKEASEHRAREAEAAKARADLRRQQRQQSNFVGSPPLEKFLTRDDQDLINSGTGQGNRDNAGFKLAANLIATCDRLPVLGIPFDGDGQGLFEEFAVRCSPPLSARDINRIWKSASKKSKPSLNDDQLEKRFSYWQWQQNPKKDSYQEPDQAEYDAYCKRLEDEEKAEEAVHKEQQRQWREQFPDRAKHAWNKAKQFSPTHKIKSKYFDFSIPEAGYLTAVKSGLGSGKTEWLRRAVELLPDEGWIALGYRNSLLLQSSERWNFSHLHIHSAFLLIKDPRCRIACCVDSLGHFEPEDFEDKNLILDEVMSIIKHLLNGSTIKDRRTQILDKFKEAVQRAKRVFILDGMLADWAVNYIKELRGDDRVIKVDNEFKREPLNIYFYLGATKLDEIRPNDKSPLISRVKRSVQPIVICSDSQLFCEAMEEILINAGMEGIRLDSKTISDDVSKEFLKNPDAWIEKHKPDYIILSPTAESGIDISIRGYFKDQYCFFFGVIDVDAMLQFLGRIRDEATQRWIWCAEFGLSDTENLRSPFPSQVEKALHQFVNEDGLRSIEGLDSSEAIAQLIQNLLEASKDEHCQTFNQIRAITNYERSNLRQCLLESLVKAGHNVSEISGDRNDDAADEYKDASEEVKQRTSTQIFNADEIDPLMAEAMNHSFSSTWEDRCKVLKAQLKKRLPGIEHSEQWSIDFIYKIRFEDRQLISKCQRYWLLTHPEAAKLQQRERWHWLVKQEKTFLGDIKSDFSIIWALQQLGIPELIESKNVWDDDSPELLELLERGKNKKVASALGISVRQSTPTMYLRRVLRVVGVELKRNRTRKDGKQVSCYSINQPSLHDPDRLVILECIDRRLQKYATGEIPVMDWGLEPKTANCHTTSTQTIVETKTATETPLNHPQEQSEQVLQPVPLLPNMYTENSKTGTANYEAITTTTGTYPEVLTPEEELDVEDCLSILNPVDNEELLHDREFNVSMMAGLKDLSQRIKKAFWSRLPDWRRQQLRQWQMG